MNPLAKLKATALIAGPGFDETGTVNEPDCVFTLPSLSVAVMV